MKGRITAAGFAFFFVMQAVVAQPRQDIGSFNIDEVRQQLEQQRTAADTTAARPAVTRQRAEGWGVIMLRISGYLALVSVLILVVLWVMKKTGVAGTAARSIPASMDVLETLPLGQGRAIVLVRLLDSVLVLAQTAQNVTLVEKLDGQKALEVISSAKGGSSIVQFKDMFNTFMGKMKKPA